MLLSYPHTSACRLASADDCLQVFASRKIMKVNASCKPGLQEQMLACRFLQTSADIFWEIKLSSSSPKQRWYKLRTWKIILRTFYIYIFETFYLYKSSAWFINKNLGFYFFSKKKQTAIYVRHFLFAMTTGLDVKNLEIPKRQNPDRMKQLWKTRRPNDDRARHSVFHQELAAIINKIVKKQKEISHITFTIAS